MKELTRNTSDSRPVSERPALASFIKETHHLLTVLGVFTALTVFAAGLSLKPVAQVLSLLFLTLTVLVWWELSSLFPPHGKGWRLYFFGEILNFLVVPTLIFYWLIEVYSAFPPVVHILVFIIVGAVILEPLRHFNLFSATFDRVFGPQWRMRESLRRAVATLLIAAVAFVSLEVSQVVAPLISTLLNDVRSYLLSIST